MPSIDLNFGRFWPKANDGYLLNDANFDKIDSTFIPLIHNVTSYCLSQIGDQIDNLYLFGSVPRGMARKGTSDLDFMVILKKDHQIKNNAWLLKLKSGLPIDSTVTDVNLEFAPINQITERLVFSEPAFVVSTHSICLHGNPIATLPFRPGIEIANHDIIRIEQRIKMAREDFLQNNSLINLHYWTPRIMKKIIRVGFLLTDQAQEEYTKDLALCFRVFSRTFPAQRIEMERALHLVFSPSHQFEESMDLLNGLGNWIIEKSNQWLNENNPKRTQDLKLSY